MRRRDALVTLATSVAAAASFSGCRSRRDGRTASLWFSYGGKNRKVLLSLVDEFHRQQDRFRIEAVYQGDYFEGLAKLRTAMHANVAPAVTHVIGEVVPYLAEAGVLDPMDRYDALRDLDLVPALSQAGCFLGGGDRPLYALPFNRSTPIAYLNGNVLAELGREPPTTWDELRDFARVATRRSGQDSVSRWGFECPVDWWFWVALVGQAGGVVVAEDGTPLLGGPAGIEALKFWQTMVHEDRTMRPPPGRDYNAWQVTNTDFLAGRAAMIWTSTAFLRYLEENASFPVVSAPLPSKVRASVPTGGTMFVLPTAGPEREREAAVAFLAWMMQPAQAIAFATQTGYIPVAQAALTQLEDEGYYREHPNARVAIDQLEHAQPWPWATQLFRIQREAVQPKLEQAVLERMDAGEALARARAVAEGR